MQKKRLRNSDWRIFVRVKKTNLMNYLSSVYFINQSLHVSGVFVARHQEVNFMYTTTGTNCCIYTLYLLMMGYKYDRNM